MGIQQDIEAEVAKTSRKKEVDQVKIMEAALARRKQKVSVYLMTAFILSGVSSARGFYLLAEAAGTVDFMSMVYTTMMAIVSAILLAGSITTLTPPINGMMRAIRNPKRTHSQVLVLAIDRKSVV